MEPLKLFTVAALVILPTVIFGGFALYRMVANGRQLSEHEEQWFRAGHGHAGVLLTLVLVSLVLLGQTDYGDAMLWTVSILLTVGVAMVSGGFFVHMSRGGPQRSSSGVAIGTGGGAVLTVALLMVAYGVGTA